MEWYLMMWQKFAEFNGRSRRKEYWMPFLINLAIGFVLYIPGIALARSGVGVVFFGLYFLYMLAVMVPAIALGVRRLHDIGKSGWWMLVGAVPLVGLVLIYFLALDSAPGANQYGANPKTA